MKSLALERLTKVTDIWTPRLVILVISSAFVLSYAALLSLALQAGYHWSLAWLWPLVMDGVIVVTSLTLVKRQMRGDRSGYVWTLLILFDGASVFLNGSAGYTTGPLTDDLVRWTFAVIHALPPLTLLLIMKLYTNEIKDDSRHAEAVQTLAELAAQIDRDRTQSEALSEEIQQLEARKTDLETDVKRLQIERRNAKKTGQGSYPTEFSQATVDKGLTILVDAIKTEGDISGAEFGRRVGISGRKGLDLKKTLWDRAAQAANGHNENGHPNGQEVSGEKA